MAYHANAALVGQHDTVLSTTSFFMLYHAGIFSIKEPAGLLRSDRKCPDYPTLIPLQAGKNAIRDMTIIATLAMSYLNSISVTADSAAE